LDGGANWDSLKRHDGPGPVSHSEYEVIPFRNRPDFLGQGAQGKRRQRKCHRERAVTKPDQPLEKPTSLHQRAGRVLTVR
jgi:hypothetical protein